MGESTSTVTTFEALDVLFSILNRLDSIENNKCYNFAHVEVIEYEKMFGVVVGGVFVAAIIVNIIKLCFILLTNN